MTNSSATLIGTLVDRSGSMSSCRAQMTEAIAHFLGEQTALPGDVQATLAQFDTEYELVYPPTPIDQIPAYSLTPRGGTALLDAMGKFITDIGEDLAARSEDDRPGTVIMVIVTDGMENSSQEWTPEQINALVTQQREDYSWEFVFLGANMDAVEVAGSYGIPTGSSLTFDTHNAAASMNSVSAYVGTYAATGTSSFTDEDRQKAMKR